MNDEILKKVLQENEELKNRVSALEAISNNMCETVSELIKFVGSEHDSNIEYRSRINLHSARFRNMKYEFLDYEGDREGYFFPKFRSDEETLRMIIEEGKSLGRFGDGEFSIAFDIERQKFQRLDEKLKNRIWQVLNEENENLIIAIANNYGRLDTYNMQAADGIRLYMSDEVRKMHEQILPSDKVYSDAYITRTYVMRKDNDKETSRKRFDAIRKIWDGRAVITVEGAQTRLGVNNDLFDNAKSIRRIVAPATNSFDAYDDIVKKCFECADKDVLFVLAIGPSSGVLAFDLSKEGYQAVDVGHLDLEYEWYKAGQGKRTEVSYKYNNEIEGGDAVEEINDPAYESQIIANFA